MIDWFNFGNDIHEYGLYPCGFGLQDITGWSEEPVNNKFFVALARKQYITLAMCPLDSDILISSFLNNLYHIVIRKI